MSLKLGYKQTEIEVIPDDWQTKTLGSLLDYEQPTPFLVISTDYLEFSSVPVLTAGKTFILGYTDEEHGVYKSLPVILFDDFTTACQWVDFPFKVKSSAAKILSGRVGVSDTKFMHEYLSRLSYVPSDHQRHWISVFSSIEVIVPPIKEQKAIAEALSDVDALIDSLEALLTKKRNIKTGVMQELLTGRTRLSGFTGDWEEVRLGDIGYIFGGLTGKSSEDFGTGNANYITFMNVISNVVSKESGVEKVSVGAGEHQSAVLPGDVLFNGSSETPEEVGFGSVVPEALAGTYLNSFCFGFRPNKDSDLDSKFFAYLTRSSLGREIIRPMAQGSTRYNLAKTNLLNGRFPRPPVKEQKAIAAVLSDIDDEIEALEKRLAKTRDLKQGMAQELLTGRTRLV